MLKRWMSYAFLTVWSFCVQGVSLESNNFEWGKSKNEYKFSEQLKERWTFSLLQECMRSKIEKELIDLGIQYEMQVEEGFLPCHFSGSYLGDEGHKIACIERVKQGDLLDFSEEFEFVKKLWKQWIQKQSKLNVQADWMQEFAFDGSFVSSEFLEESARILQNLSVEDLVSSFHSQDKVLIEPPLDFKTSFAFRNELARHSSLSSSKKGWEPAGGGRGGEPKSEEAKLFFNLPLTDEDKRIIRDIVTTMAEKNVVMLLLEKSSMERKGDKIQPVHPLRFAGYVLTDPLLKRHMKTVSKSTFKWNGFLDGYEKRLKEEARAGTLNCYVPGLADLLEVDRHVIQQYINQGNYGGLIKHFL